MSNVLTVRRKRGSPTKNKNRGNRVYLLNSPLMWSSSNSPLFIRVLLTTNPKVEFFPQNNLSGSIEGPQIISDFLTYFS